MNIWIPLNIFRYLCSVMNNQHTAIKFDLTLFIALEFDRWFSSTAAEPPVKFQSNWKTCATISNVETSYNMEIKLSYCLLNRGLHFIGPSVLHCQKHWWPLCNTISYSESLSAQGAIAIVCIPLILIIHRVHTLSNQIHFLFLGGPPMSRCYVRFINYFDLFISIVDIQMHSCHWIALNWLKIPLIFLSVLILMECEWTVCVLVIT